MKRLVPGLMLLAAAVEPSRASPQVLFSRPVSRTRHVVRRIYAHPVHGLYMIGTIYHASGDQNVVLEPFLARYSLAGERLWMAPLSDRVYYPNGLTVDDSGTVYVVGQSAQNAGGGTVAEIALYSTTGLRIFAQTLGANRNTAAWDIAVSANGDYTVTGQTTATDFPTTPGAIIPSIQQPNSFGRSNFAFVTRFSREHRILASTYLGGYKTNCSGGSSCIGVVGQTSGYAVRVDGSGNSFVTGYTNATDFPVTGGAPVGAGFAAKLNPTASRILYALHTPVSNSGGGMHLGPTGIVTAAGFERPLGFGPRGLVYQLSPSGDSYSYLSYLSDGSSEIRALAADAEGNIWVSGGATSAEFPDTEDSFRRGDNFVMKICFSGCTGARSARLPQGMSDGALAVAGDRVFVSGASGSFSALHFDGASPTLYGVASAAGGGVKASVSIGEIVTLFGTAIGPDQPLSARPDSAGLYPMALGGAELRFDGFPAPLLYAQSDQLNAVVPLALAGRASAVLELHKDGVRVASREIQLHAAAPALFLSGPAAPWSSVALNQDGSVNSRENPAPRGSIVSLFGTGFGPVAPQPPDGMVTRDPYPLITMPLAARSRDQPLEITYAGYAPGLVAGTVQVNVRLPAAGFGPGPPYVGTLLLSFALDSYSADAAVWMRY